jgi:hypothetical protein
MPLDLRRHNSENEMGTRGVKCAHELVENVELAQIQLAARGEDGTVGFNNWAVRICDQSADSALLSGSQSRLGCCDRVRCCVRCWGLTKVEQGSSIRAVGAVPVQSKKALGVVTIVGFVSSASLFLAA